MSSIRHTLAVALLLACSFTGSASADAPLKPYSVGYNNWIGYIALFVAQEQGLFKKEGLDVQTKMFSSPGDGIAPLLAGSLDGHLTTADSVITALDKAPGQLVNVFMTDTSAGADAVLAKSTIESVQALKGKTVAATSGQCNELLLAKALEKAGLTIKDVQLTNMNPDDAGAAFAAGKLDAAVTWEPWISKVQGEKKGHVIFSSKDVPNLILDTFAISKKTADTKAAETKSFVRALEQANAWVIAHPKEAAAIAAKPLEQSADEVAAMLPKVKLYDAAANKAQMGTKTAPGPALAVAKELATFFKQREVNTTDVDPATVFDASYLP